MVSCWTTGDSMVMGETWDGASHRRGGMGRIGLGGMGQVGLPALGSGTCSGAGTGGMKGGSSNRGRHASGPCIQVAEKNTKFIKIPSTNYFTKKCKGFPPPTHKKIEAHTKTSITNTEETKEMTGTSVKTIPDSTSS